MPVMGDGDGDGDSKMGSGCGIGWDGDGDGNSDGLNPQAIVPRMGSHHVSEAMFRGPCR